MCIMKVLEHIAEMQIRRSIRIDDIQLGFMPGCGYSRCHIHCKTVAGQISCKKQKSVPCVC